MKNDFLFLVRFVDPVINEEDFVVYHSSSLSALFNEIIDFIGKDGKLIGVERIYITDLDIVEVLNNEI